MTGYRLKITINHTYTIFPMALHILWEEGVKRTNSNYDNSISMPLYLLVLFHTFIDSEAPEEMHGNIFQG